jgi:hypothetical protein
MGGAVTLRGRICRTEHELEYLPQRNPAITCQEQDFAAAALVEFWVRYHTEHGRAPTAEVILRADLPHIGRVRWRATLMVLYVRNAGLLPEGVCKDPGG